MSLIPPYLRMIPGGAADNINNRSNTRQLPGTIKGKDDACPVSVAFSPGCKAPKLIAFDCMPEADSALENIVRGLKCSASQATPGEIHSFLNHQNALSLLTS